MVPALVVSSFKKLKLSTLSLSVSLSISFLLSFIILIILIFIRYLYCCEDKRKVREGSMTLSVSFSIFFFFLLIILFILIIIRYSYFCEATESERGRIEGVFETIRTCCWIATSGWPATTRHDPALLVGMEPIKITVETILQGICGVSPEDGQFQRSLFFFVFFFSVFLLILLTLIILILIMIYILCVYSVVVCPIIMRS